MPKVDTLSDPDPPAVFDADAVAGRALLALYVDVAAFVDVEATGTNVEPDMLDACVSPN